MNSLYGATIFLILTLIAMTITVFVFAVSLLGHAIEIASEKKKKLHQERKEKVKKDIEELQKRLPEVKESGKLEIIEKQLTTLQQKQKEIEKKLKYVHKRYQFMTVKGAVFYPIWFFLGSLAFAAIAKALASICSPYLWIVSLTLISFGVCRFFQCLKVIEEVSVLSREMAEKKAIETSKSALAEYYETRRPKLALSFPPGTPPFRFKKDLTMSIRYTVILTQGAAAKDVRVFFFVPDGFEFLNTKTCRQSKTYLDFPNSLTAMHQWKKTLIKGISYDGEITLKIPSSPGKFTLGYRLICIEFEGENEKFEVIVEE